MQDHPGFFGMTSKGVIHIHADWPVYPEEHGANLVLFWLTAFPNGTAFKSIDDIDRCSLFLADVKYSNRANQSDERNFHVAVWHDDLLSLRKSGFVDGVSPVSERRWRELERSSLPPNAFFVAEDGIRRELQLPPSTSTTKTMRLGPSLTLEALLSLPLVVAR